MQEVCRSLVRSILRENVFLEHPDLLKTVRKPVKYNNNRTGRSGNQAGNGAAPLYRFVAPQSPIVGTPRVQNFHLPDSEDSFDGTDEDERNLVDDPEGSDAEEDDQEAMRWGDLLSMLRNRILPV